MSEEHSGGTHRAADSSQEARAKRSARTHRAVVRLSEVDARRVESGELRDAAEALQRLARGDGGAELPRAATSSTRPALKGDAPGTNTVAARDTAASAREIRARDIVARTAHEQSILDERPPHFGKL